MKRLYNNYGREHQAELLKASIIGCLALKRLLRNKNVFVSEKLIAEALEVSPKTISRAAAQLRKFQDSLKENQT